MILNDNHFLIIIDFGFSTQLTTKAKLTTFCCTPLYMAPKIILKTPYNGQASDVWALGVSLYILLTRKFPFQGDTESQLYRKIVNRKFELPQFASQEGRALIEKMLSKNPDERPSCNMIMNDPFMPYCRDGIALKPYKSKFSRNP